MIGIPSHSQVFLDTNILLYAVTDHPRFGQWCNTLLDRIHRGDVTGHVSAIVLNEFIHKLIIGEVAQKTGLKQAHRLMSNDALHLAVMQKSNLQNLVTNDSDFDGIEGVHVWKPQVTP